MRRGDRPLDDNEEIVIPLGWAEGQTLGPPPHPAEPHVQMQEVFSPP